MSTEIHQHLDTLLPDLKLLKEAGQQQEFRDKLLKALPKVKRYIARSLSTAVSNGQLREGSCSVNEVVDELYIRAYEHLNEVPDPKLFNTWLQLQAEAVLVDKMDDQEFHKLFFTGIDKFSEQEWNDMEEKYSVDGDGDRMLLEEFDDLTVERQPRYALNEVFVKDNEQAMIENIDQHLSEEAAQRHVEMLLSKLPLGMRTTFDLHFAQGRTLQQIAALRKSTLDRIQAELQQAREWIKQSFNGRFWS